MPKAPDGHLASRALRRVGTSLCRRYHVHRLIGIGGMAAVYAGLHRNGHPVAIKILHERLSTDPEIERLFRREALLANRIGHPGVVPVIDDDVSEDGATFLVMPLLRGETARARAERLGGKLPVEEVARIGSALLDALQAAHAKKIVHRDIKPENAFITQDGDVRVLDFGIARFFETNDPVSSTRSGRAVGTPAFMAPEQALGRLRDVDGRTDVWAVGATMFTLASGRHVHESETANESLVLAATRPPPSLRDVAAVIPEGLCAVIDRALAFERSARWDSAAAMGRALQTASEASFGRSLSALPSLSGSAPDGVEDVDSEAMLHGDTTIQPSSRGTALAITRVEGRRLGLVPRSVGQVAVARTALAMKPARR